MQNELAQNDAKVTFYIRPRNDIHALGIMLAEIFDLYAEPKRQKMSLHEFICSLNSKDTDVVDEKHPKFSHNTRLKDPTVRPGYSRN